MARLSGASSAILLLMKRDSGWLVVIYVPSTDTELRCDVMIVDYSKCLVEVGVVAMLKDSI
jgi:hypothetical protein